MKIKRVAKLLPIDRFLYWIEERHQIYLRREVGRPKPWTDDEVMLNYFFTCPYRENDKTTVWFRENIRGPMAEEHGVAFATICFRWFNYIPTGELLIKKGLLTNWDEAEARSVLAEAATTGKVFTGAYMISGKVYTGMKKTDCVCKLLQPVWKDGDNLAIEIEESRSLETATNIIREYRGLGGFMAYEIVCDLRYTMLLRNAVDKLTWCNPGPGCRRGLARINGWTVSSDTTPTLPKDWLSQMRDLLSIANDSLYRMPNFEMREIEHSLCEWDKYERLRLEEGPSKRRYDAN